MTGPASPSPTRGASPHEHAPPDGDGEADRVRDAVLAAMAEFCHGAGHEINNPAAAILGRVALLSRKHDDPELRRDLRTIARQALRVRDMIADALLFADPPPLRAEPLDLAEVVEGALAGLREHAADAGCVLETDLAPAPLVGDPTMIAAAAAALGRNAIEAGASRLRFRVRSSRSQITLWVADDGPGFSEADREHAFAPFYSGRQAGRGLGFGLPKCWRVVTLHGGTVRVRSRPGATAFRVALPPAPPPAGAPRLNAPR